MKIFYKLSDLIGTNVKILQIKIDVIEVLIMKFINFKSYLIDIQSPEKKFKIISSVLYDTIEESDNTDEGVKVFSDNEGDKDNEIDESKGSSLMSKQVALDLVRATATKKEIIPNKKTDELSVEFANLTSDGVKRIGKVSMTPEICRTGCKHYDGVKDRNDGQFKEFCCQRGMTKIDEGRYCACFESKQPKLPEGVLPM